MGQSVAHRRNGLPAGAGRGHAPTSTPHLPGRGLTLINQNIGFIRKDAALIYIYGNLPVFTHAIDDVPSFRMFTIQLYTPKHGSWLNMAEIELNVLTNKCLNRRIDDIEVASKEGNAWQKHRNNRQAKVNWQFTTKDARIKLSRLYPTLES